MVAKTVERKIHFYAIKFPKYDDKGGVGYVTPYVVFGRVGALFGKPNMYLLVGQDAVFARVDSVRRNEILGAVITSRRSNWPWLEQGGNISPLIIPTGSGLGEVTHFAIFEEKILGVEYNFYGPRANRLCDYVKHAARPLIDEVDLILLINKDAAKTLRRFGEIKEFDLRVRADAAAVWEDASPDLASTFRTFGKLTDADDYEIVFRKKGRNKWFSKLGFRKILPEFLSRADVRDKTDICRVRARDINTNKTASYDLLADRMILAKKVVKPDTRYNAVDQEGMYNAIREAYAELREHLYLIIKEDEI
jgi:hypothetical protein